LGRWRCLTSTTSSTTSGLHLVRSLRTTATMRLQRHLGSPTVFQDPDLGLLYLAYFSRVAISLLLYYSNTSAMPVRCNGHNVDG
jgi:hypothetical protein